MSMISPVGTDANGQTQQTGSMQSLGKDDFLQLLVTKLQHQDPLEPMDDEDFIAQLAQFSSLEQMNNIADGISTSNEWDFLQMQSLNNTMASGLIGKEVDARYSGIYFDGSAASNISYTTDEYATSATFVVRDSDGNIVRTLQESDVQAGTGAVSWDGTDSHGNRVAEGYYSVEATAVSGDGQDFTPTLGMIGVVEAISYRDGSAFLNINGLEIPLGDVRGIGEPGAFSETDEEEG